jgi:diguanylate cyclase (GGDEF)-like protein
MSIMGISFKFRLTHKLVAVFLATFLSIITLILLATKLLVTDSFQTYLQELQWQRADHVIEEVILVIEKNNNDIGVFSRDPQAWHDLIGRVFAGQISSMPPGPPPAGMPGAEPGFPPHLVPGQGLPGLPPFAVMTTSLKDVEISLVRDSLSLYDMSGNPLGGPAIELQDQLRKDVRVNGELVGFLVMRNLIDIKDPRTLIFHQNFNRILVLTGSVGILMAFLVSIVVAKRLLAPVERLIQGTRALAEKKLDTRISVTSDDELGQLAENFNRMADQIEQMTRELMNLSLQDPLTSLHNRRYFEQFIAPEARSLVKERLYKNRIGDERLTEDLKGLGLLIIDIDNFKQVNDGFGHDVGDRILKQFSEIISFGIRETDAVIRMGGEEFLIALKNTRFDCLSIYAEKVRCRIAEHEFEIDDQVNTIKLTCSIGFSLFPFSEKNPDFLDVGDTLNIADLSLYYAKHNGRNMCVGLKPVSETIPGCDKAVLLTDIDYGVRQGVWRLELPSSS